MRFLTLLSAAGLATRALGSGSHYQPHGIENLITFGDSYTDEGRLAAYAANGGKTPPAGTNTSGSNMTAVGGFPWGHWASGSLGAKYYDYAVSGAFCSNDIFSRVLASINRTFPSVLEDEIPSFLQDRNYTNASTGARFFSGPELTARNTLYAMWIGTNDLGIDAFLTDSQHAGLTLSDFTGCVFAVLDALYASGGRRFALFNEAPLELSPLYASVGNGGIGNGLYWANKTAYNTSEYEVKMRQFGTSVNTMLEYGVGFEKAVKRRWRGAEVYVFDVHSLMTDIHDSPGMYLSSPANVTGYFHRCNATGQACVNAAEPAASFLWYDALHPSERTSQVIAEEFVKMLNGTSKYGSCY